MPPSGFSQEAINGLLEFVQDAYQKTLDLFKGKDLGEEAALKESIRYLESISEKYAKATLGETLSQKGITGLSRFVCANFMDLIEEMHQGKKQEGYALQAEIESIGRYLEKFRI